MRESYFGDSLNMHIYHKNRHKEEMKYVRYVFQFSFNNKILLKHVRIFIFI